MKKVIYLNSKFLSLGKYKRDYIIDKDINHFIPQFFHKDHDQRFSDFITGTHDRHYKSIMERVWLKTEDKDLVPVKMTI